MIAGDEVRRAHLGVRHCPVRQRLVVLRLQQLDVGEELLLLRQHHAEHVVALADPVHVLVRAQSVVALDRGVDLAAELVRLPRALHRLCALVDLGRRAVLHQRPQLRRDGHGKLVLLLGKAIGIGAVLAGEFGAHRGAAPVLFGALCPLLCRHLHPPTRRQMRITATALRLSHLFGR